MSSTTYSAPDRRTTGTRTPRDRQVAVTLFALLVTNGLVCWLNTLQHTSLSVPVTRVGNYALLGLWFGAFAVVRTGRHLWGAVMVGVAIVASHVCLLIFRPGHFTAGLSFWLTMVCELSLLATLVTQELRANHSAPEPRSEPVAALAPVVPMRTTTTSVSAGVRRAA